MRKLFWSFSVVMMALSLAACTDEKATRTLTFMDGDEVLLSQNYVVGEALEDVQYPNLNTEGRTFFGWSDAIPNTMPDTDVTLHAVWAFSDVIDYEIVNEEVTLLAYLGLKPELVIPSTLNGYPVVAIGNAAFQDNAIVTHVTLPEGVKTIGDDAFRNSSIEHLEVPRSLLSIGNRAFQDATSLTTVTFAQDSQLESIGQSAFSQASALTNLHLPERLVSIGRWAFQDASGLTSIHLPGSLTSVGASPFRGASNLVSITVDEANATFTSVNGVLFDQQMTTLLKYPEGMELSEYTVPASVTEIGEFAFSYLDVLTTVLFAQGSEVENIGVGAFQNARALTTIHLPASVLNIGTSAFKGATALTTVTFAPASQLRFINTSAFEETVSLTTLEIPPSVTTIGSHAFKGARALTSLHLSASITSLGRNAFEGAQTLTLTAEVPSRPSGWHEDWNPLNRPVIWGYTHE